MGWTPGYGPILPAAGARRKVQWPHLSPRRRPGYDAPVGGSRSCTMTPDEWRTCARPLPMLVFLHQRLTERQQRLFAAACCRRVWHLLEDERSRAAVEATEAY